MENGSATNGGNSPNHLRAPSLASFSLTEYSANPSPPSESTESKVSSIIPQEFMLPTGYPDVSMLNCILRAAANQLISIYD